MRHRFLSLILSPVAVLCYSLAVFAQASAPSNAKSANEAIYSGKHPGEVVGRYSTLVVFP